MGNTKKNKFSLKMRLKSFRHAGRGIYHYFREEHNVWIHTLVTVIVVITGVLLNITSFEWCLIIFAIGLVFIAEIINTAIELLVDLISPEYNKLAGLIKDIAAGTVLIAAITSAIIGLIIFFPKLLYLF